MFSSITFLNPALLVGLFAALIPLLIYLLNRRKAEQVSFSTLALLRALERDRARKVRIKQWLLLVLRSLILFLAALSLARPAVRGVMARGVGTHARTSLVLLLDHSLSMSYETDEGSLLDLAKARALEVVELLQPDDEVFFVPFTDAPTTQSAEPTSHFQTVKKAVAALEPSYRSTDVKAAVDYALTLLSGAANPNREVYLFTDMTANGWSALKDPLPSLGVTFYVVDLSVPHRRDLSVDDVRVPSQILMQGRPFSVETTVSNRANEPVRSCSIALYLELERVRQQTLDLDPNQTRPIAFYTRFEQPGLQTGHVEIVESSVGQDDRMLMDNRVYFAVDVPRQARVLLVGHEPQDTYFLGRALSPSEDSLAFVQAEEKTLSRLVPQDVSARDVVVLSNVPSLSEPLLRAVREHVAQGGGLVLCLGPDVDARFYNERLLPGILPAKLKAPVGSPNRREVYQAWGKVDFEHPIFDDLIAPEDLDPPHSYVVYDVAFSVEARPIVHYAGGGVALAESRASAGTCILLAGAVRLEWTDLPLKGVFVPFLYRTVQYLAAGRAAQKPLFVGRPMDRPLGARLLEGPVRLVHPLGDSVALMPTLTRDGYVARLQALDHPGIWRIVAGARQLDAFALNVPPEEFEPEVLPHGRARHLLGEQDTRMLSASSVMERQILQSRYGRELWKACLSVAFALMIAEMLIARTRQSEVPV